jgi:hypothetical protein
LIRAYQGIAISVKLADQLKRKNIPDTDPRMKEAKEHLAASDADRKTHGITYAKYLSLAPLAKAEDVVPLATSIWNNVRDLSFSTPELMDANVPELLKELDSLILKLQTAGRKELWGTPEPAEVDSLT